MSKKSLKGITGDDRFKSASFDPRFNLPSLKKNKIKVDERFSKAEIRKLNASTTGRKATVDRYGRKIEKNPDSDFDKYFEEENTQEKSSGENLSSDNEDDSESEGSEKDDNGNKKSLKVDDESKNALNSSNDSDDSADGEDSDDAKVFVDRARGEGLISDSDDSDSDSDSDSDVDSEEIELEEQKPEEGDPSATFAVVNLDWDNVRAVDLMSTFASFVPKAGNIKSVTIYPSEYGKEQMRKEEVEGPPKELFRSKKKKQDDSDSDDDLDLDLSNKEDLEKAARKLYEEDNGEEDYDSKALRRYQLQRLRYYYAVVRCDSIQTAKNIYENCDGSEYESTANIFDLRYVPEGMEFDEDEAKEVCTKIPSSYRPDSTFVTDALQHSKVKLTWDETPKERLTLSTRLFSQKEIDDMDFKAYLASDSEESEAESSLLKDRYKNLLGGKFSFDKGKTEDNDEEDVDMEITFNPGLDESKVEDVEAKEETTIEAYKRKEKERREKRMEKFKSKNDEESGDSVTDKSKKGKKHDKKKPHGDAKSQAELELLMMNEEDKQNDEGHFSMRDVVKAEKKKGKKRGKKNYDEDLIQDDFKPDVTDDRFKEAFESHEFAIDPTNSEFKKTNAMKEILKERSKRLHKSDAMKKKHKKAKTSGSQGAELKTLVSKFKQKK